MITIRKDFFVENTDRFSGIFQETDSQFAMFDIETTGLSAATSGLYLIGVCYHLSGEAPSCFHLIQWFGERFCDESRILRAFADFSKDFRFFFSYNGSLFDLNYLKNVCEHYYLDDVRQKLLEIESMHCDLLKALKKFKTLFDLPNLRLKTVEQHLGIDRKDLYSGFELISQYEEFLSDPSRTDLLDNLLLHNEEDIRNLIPLLPIRTLQKIYEGTFPYFTADVSATLGKDGIVLNGFFPEELPFAFEPDVPYLKNVRIRKDRFSLEIPFYTGEMKLFFSPAKDYFYLPMEDMAIHKSIAQFTDSSHRVKATEKTCYQKRFGTFLPQLGEWEQFRPSYSFEPGKQLITYFEYSGREIENPALDKWSAGLIRSLFFT